MIIAVDFDGTIVEHRFPEIGKEIPNAIAVLKKLQADGHTLILWTYRSGEELKQAIKYCRKSGLVFNTVNRNSDDEDFDFTYSRKIYADLFIDDRNILGIPDWNTSYEIVTAIKEKMLSE